ncbi:MAG: hypothetical protein HY549_11475 [Elusimicrobia bacterium]|nr:hypothetical protein [Elusimicrobiota bacterium]
MPNRGIGAGRAAVLLAVLCPLAYGAPLSRPPRIFSLIKPDKVYSPMMLKRLQSLDFGSIVSGSFKGTPQEIEPFITALRERLHKEGYIERRLYEDDHPVLPQMTMGIVDRLAEQDADALKSLLREAYAEYRDEVALGAASLLALGREFADRPGEDPDTARHQLQRAAHLIEFYLEHFSTHFPGASELQAARHGLEAAHLQRFGTPIKASANAEIGETLGGLRSPWPMEAGNDPTPKLMADRFEIFMESLLAASDGSRPKHAREDAQGAADVKLRTDEAQAAEFLERAVEGLAKADPEQRTLAYDYLGRRLARVGSNTGKPEAFLSLERVIARQELSPEFWVEMGESFPHFPAQWQERLLRQWPAHELEPLGPEAKRKRESLYESFRFTVVESLQIATVQNIEAVRLLLGDSPLFTRTGQILRFLYDIPEHVPSDLRDKSYLWSLAQIQELSRNRTASYLLSKLTWALRDAVKRVDASRRSVREEIKRTLRAIAVPAADVLLREMEKSESDEAKARPKAVQSRK